MPAKTAPGLGLSYGWTLGESGQSVKDGLDRNFLYASILSQLTVKSMSSALPSGAANGDRYIVPSSDPTNAGKIAVRLDGAWTYIAPGRNWQARVEDSGDALVVFNGTAWVAQSGVAPVLSPSGALPVATLTEIKTSPDMGPGGAFDFLSLTVPAEDLKAGLTLDAKFFGTQTHGAVSQDLRFYVKVNDGAEIVIGQFDVGGSAQIGRAISGVAMLTLYQTGASGTFGVAGNFNVNGQASYSSNSNAEHAVDTSAGMKLTLGLEYSKPDAGSFVTIPTALIQSHG